MEMHPVLVVLIIIAMVAVVGVLFAGVFSMASGGKFNEKYGNKLMRWRVILQLVAVLLLGLLFLMSGD